jgi:adenylyl-sulfate kinase
MPKDSFADAGLVVWLTGLSASGKSSIARAVFAELSAGGVDAELLDGDDLRQTLCRDLGFSAEDRRENNRRIGELAATRAHAGKIVLVAAIAPFRETREQLRARIGCFVEVFVDAPLPICESRDRKGLYQRARSGALAGFTGIDSPYEPPVAPEVHCRTGRETLAESPAKVLAYILPLQSATSASKRISRRQMATSGEQASTGRAAP